MKKMYPKNNFRNIDCYHCSKPLSDGWDMVIYNVTPSGEISDLRFVHGRGMGCDDKDFKRSRHVKEGYQDLLDQWKISSYNEENKARITETSK